MTDIQQNQVQSQKLPACTAVLVDLHGDVKRELFRFHVSKDATFIGVAVETGGEISIIIGRGDVKTSVGTGIIASNECDYALDVRPVRDSEDT